MGILAVITARGGSKRIPQKNIRPFFGKPMIGYAIEAAQKSGLFEEIMVSTDSNEIATVAKQFGASVPFMRSEKTSDDFATTYDVIAEVIGEYKNRGKKFDTLCCIYPCVPFLKSETLVEASKMLKDADAVQPVCKYPVPIEWAMKIEKGILVPNDRSAQLIRSQDLEEKYFDVGMFYFCKTSAMIAEGTLTPVKTSGYIINEMECQDIDTLADWEMAELKYSMLRGVK